MGGFALGGVLIAVFSPRPLLLLDAASFLASAVLLRVGTRERPPHAGKPAGSPATGAAVGAPYRSVARDSLAGVRLALGSPTLRPLLLFYWLPPAFTIAPEALAAPYVARLGGSPAAVGLLLASAAAGSVAGMLTAGSWLSLSRRLRLMVPLATWTFVPLLCFVAYPGLIPAMVLLALSGFGWAYSIGLDQRLLDATPEHLRGHPALPPPASCSPMASASPPPAPPPSFRPPGRHRRQQPRRLLVVALLARPVTRALSKGMPGTIEPHQPCSPRTISGRE